MPICGLRFWGCVASCKYAHKSAGYLLHAGKICPPVLQVQARWALHILRYAHDLMVLVCLHFGLVHDSLLP